MVSPRFSSIAKVYPSPLSQRTHHISTNGNRNPPGGKLTRELSFFHSIFHPKTISLVNYYYYLLSVSCILLQSFSTLPQSYPSSNLARLKGSPTALPSRRLWSIALSYDRLWPGGLSSSLLWCSATANSRLLSKPVFWNGACGGRIDDTLGYRICTSTTVSVVRDEV